MQRQKKQLDWRVVAGQSLGWVQDHARLLAIMTGAIFVALTTSFVVGLFASAEAAKRLEARLGLRVEVRRVSFGLFGAGLRHVVFRPALSDAFALTMDAVDFDTGFLGWLHPSVGSIEAVRVDGAYLRVTLDDPDLPHALKHARAQTQSKGGASLGGFGPTLRALPKIIGEDIAIDLVRSDKTIVSLSGVEFGVVEPRLSATIERVVLNTERGDYGEFTPIKLWGKLNSVRPLRVVVENIQVARANLAWRARRGDVDDGLPEEIGKGKKRIQEAPKLSGPSRLSRLMGFFLDPGPEAKVRVERVELLRAHVETATSKGRETLLDNFRGSFRLDGQNRILTRGAGTTRDKGELAWDLSGSRRDRVIEGSVKFSGITLALIVPFLPNVPWLEPERSPLSGQLVIHSEGIKRVAFQGHVDLGNVSVSSPRIAPKPVRGMSLGLEGSGYIVPDTRRLELLNSTIRVGGVRADTTGSVEWNKDHYAVSLATSVPPMSCDVAVKSIPADALSEFGGFEMTGFLSAKGELMVDSRDLSATVFNVDVDDHCGFLRVPQAADVSRFSEPFIHRVVEPDGRAIEFETGPGAAAWTPLSQISLFLVHSILAHEDGGFFIHHGFSVRSIRDAIERNLREGRYVKGASTITMQLVKNLYLHREKHLARKLQEALLTWMIERTLKKGSILELYLNVIEYGPDVYGIKEAARYYFSTTPEKLSPAQAVFIGTMLPNPKLYSGQLRRGELSPGWQNTMRRILERMQSRGQIDEEALKYGLAELETFSFRTENASVLPSGHTQPLPFESRYAEDIGPWLIAHPRVKEGASSDAQDVTKPVSDAPAPRAHKAAEMPKDEGSWP